MDFCVLTMKFNININQYELSKNKDITIQDSAVIDWLFTICGSDSEKISKKRIEGWTWVSLSHLIEDMPLLRIKTNSGASKLVRRIKSLGFIETKKDTKERKLYVKPTEKLKNLYFSKSPKSQVQIDPSQVLENQSQVLCDPNHNTNTLILNPIQVATTKESVKDDNKNPTKEVKPFVFKEELKTLGESKWKPKLIVYNYFLRKNMVFENREQFNSAVGRFLKPAQQLDGYSSKQIQATMDYLDNKKLSWSLETIAKNISEVVNRK